MKKILLLPIFILSVNLSTYSQCDVRNIAVHLKQITNTGGQCEVLFDLSYEQAVNSGNKFAFIHLWRSDQYPDLLANNMAYVPTANNPDATDLQLAIANFVITDNHDVNLAALGTSYPAEPTVPIMLTPQMSLAKEQVDADWQRTTIKNIFLTLPNCTGVSITGDIWGCQAANGANVHCYSTGFRFIVGNPKIAGLLKCTVPRTYDLSVENLGPDPIQVTYKIYVDEGDKNYEPTTHDQLAASYLTPITIASGASYSVTNQGYPPYDALKPYSDRGIWIEVSVAGFPNKAIYYLNNLCAPLPVVYSSFTAARTGEKVDIRWTTATETNNAGFEIQRRVGSGYYEIIATVVTKALLGNSTSEINYTYADNNPTHAVSVYRIRQFDIDARYTYSDERLVAGEGMNIHVFPNPVSGNNFHVVLENPQQVHDVAMFDSYGRVVQQWFNVTASELVVRKPSPGMYIIKVINKTTQEVETTRIIVMAQ